MFGMSGASINILKALTSYPSWSNLLHHVMREYIQKKKKTSFHSNITIILLTALLYASMCSYASTLLLCSKLCQHNSSRPNIVRAWTVNFENRLVKNPKHITQSPLNPNLTFIHLHHKQLVKNAKITHLHHKCLR